jgi:hypothetical protein
MAITAEEIMEQMEKHREELVAHMVEEVKKSISYKVEWTVKEEVAKLVTEFVKTEVADEIRSQLTESKPAIMKAVSVFAETLSAELVEGMLAQARENLKNSYRRSEMLKQLFS